MAERKITPDTMEELAARLDPLPKRAYPMDESFIVLDATAAQAVATEAAALLRRFGRVPKLETDAVIRAHWRRCTTEAYWKLERQDVRALLHDIDALLSRISADGATEVENG